MASDNESIHELLVQLKHGSGTAEVASAIYRRMFMQLYRYGVKEFRLIPQDADELASTTLMHILFGKKRNGEAVISSYNEKQHTGEPWIKRVFARKVLDWKREESKRQGREVPFDERQEILLDDPNINAYISPSEEWDPEQYLLMKEQNEDKDTVKKRRVSSQVWAELSEEEQEEFEKGPGRGGTKEKPGRNAYWVVRERACTLFQKYWSLPEDLED
jgi:hypothetical protein